MKTLRRFQYDEILILAMEKFCEKNGMPEFFNGNANTKIHTNRFTGEVSIGYVDVEFDVEFDDE